MLARRCANPATRILVRKTIQTLQTLGSWYQARTCMGWSSQYELLLHSYVSYFKASGTNGRLLRSSTQRASHACLGHACPCRWSKPPATWHSTFETRHWRKAPSKPPKTDQNNSAPVNLARLLDAAEKQPLCWQKTAHSRQHLCVWSNLQLQSSECFTAVYIAWRWY